MDRDLLREFGSYPGLLLDVVKVKRVLVPREVSFGPDKDQYFLHFAPTGAAKGPVVCYLHGGGWNSGSPRQLWSIGQRFALEGYHCVMPGYRKSPRKWPTQLEDVGLGFRKMVEYLAAVNADPSRIAVVGSSAGAHLGAFLCFDPEFQERARIDHQRLVGYAGLGGPYSFSLDPTKVLSLLADQLFPEGWDRTTAEPLNRLNGERKLPMLIVHSAHDGVVSDAGAMALYHKALALDIPVRYCAPLPPGNTHSVYTAGCILTRRVPGGVLDALLTWLEGL